MKTNLYFLIPLMMIAVGCTSEGINDLSGDVYNRLVKSVKCDCWFEKSTFEFKYDDNNRLCYVTEKRYDEEGLLVADNNYSYSYLSDNVMVIGTMNEERYGEMTKFSVKYTYDFNNGVLASELWEQSWGGYSTETNYYYDTSGKLYRIKAEGLDTYEMLINWRDGNIVADSVYSSVLNKSNLDFSCFIDGQFDPKSDRNVFKGLHSVNLPERSGNDYVYCIYSYEYDDSGYPVKIRTSYFGEDPESQGESGLVEIKYY